MLKDYCIADGSVVVLLVSDDQEEVVQAVLKVPIDRCFDVQWNPPGNPLLRCSTLRQPYGDRSASTSEGDFYTFTEVGDTTTFVRVRPSGEEIVVFRTCTWVSVNDDVLHFNGDGSYGTLVKGIQIESGPADGT